jgi:tetratricopeptide repeat protein 21B
MLRQTQRAKNHLKRICKNQWTFEEAEYLEKSWLLLSDIYIQASKFDIANDLLQKVLKHNKSSYKAYELCGVIAEKEQNFKNAAGHYDQGGIFFRLAANSTKLFCFAAWKYSGKQRPYIAHKLAYSNMKSKKFADAIEICQQVLKNFPEYTQVREIFEKSRNNLKT